MTDILELRQSSPDPARMAVEEYVGHVDQFDDFSLSGWIYSRSEAASAAVELDIYFEGRRVTTTRPDASRKDLKAFFGATQVGFIADLTSIGPEILSTCSGAPSSEEATAIICGALDVRVVGTSIALSKAKFRLGRPFNAGFSRGATLPAPPVPVGVAAAPSVAPAATAIAPPRPEIYAEEGELGWQFDRTFYLQAEPDVAAAGCDPLWHYNQFGEREGRKPNPFFDPNFYRDVYADVREAGISPLKHYRDSGRFEGRLPSLPVAGIESLGRSILFVGHDSYAAGSQRVLLETVRWFKRHTTFNVRVMLLGFGHLTSDFASSAKTYTSVNIDKDYEYIVEHFFSRRPPEVVYCNTVVSGSLFGTKMAGFLRHSKVIAHCHEMANVLREFPRQLDALVSRADHWICASAAIPPYLESECGVAEASISVVLPFIQPSTIAAPALPAYRAATRATFSIPANDFVVVGCGTVYARKGPDIFLEVAKRVIAKNPMPAVHFLWIGDGEEREELEADILRNGLEGFIRFTGFRKESADLIAMSDVLFLPSREDPFPLVVLEAAQFGIPSICFRDGVGIAAFVGAGRGIVLDERRPEKAATAIELLLSNNGLRTQLGAKAQASVFADHFTKSAMRKIMGKIHGLDIAPAVSVIVPNYNHEKFIDQRLQSVLSQTIEDYEIIVLDDCSTDASVAAILPYTSDPRVRLVTNEVNSGSVFSQWRKGLDLARGEVIWIAESDDYCENDFLELLLPSMTDADINIAFARTKIVDEAGNIKVGALRPYMDRFGPGFGLEDFKSSGAKFVNDGFGALCTIVNASGALLRKKVVQDALFSTGSYRMCGDWRTYLECCLSGSVSYSAKATNYFRRHSASTVHRLEGSDQYFSERLAIAEFVISKFWTTPFLLRKMQAEVFHEVSRFKGRFDPSFRGLGSEMFARSRSRRYVNELVHVCFYVHGLLISKGGIERLFALIASALVDRGYRVSVACRPSKGKGSVYPLRHGIEILPVDIYTERGQSQLRAHLLLKRVDVLVPMLSENLFENIVGAARDLAIPVIASEHNDPWVIEREWWSPEARRATFAECRSIHLLSNQFRNSLPNSLRPRIRVIPNPVTPGFFGCTRKPSERRRIVAVGRLTYQKHFDILIHAFALIASYFPDWDLAIFGEGDMRLELEQIVADYKLQKRVALPGESDRLPAEMELSDIIVMPSRFEGFGMALVEGMAAGLPGVAFAHCNGPNEIIQDGGNGLLVGVRTPEALALAIERLVANDELRLRLGARARGVALKFSLEAVVDSWEEMISVDGSLV